MGDKAKFTPAPWLAEGPFVYALEHHDWMRGKERMRNRFHCPVYGWKETPPEELEANARLMAAAPELLTVCKLITGADMDKGLSPLALGILIMAAQDAIKKAEGESTTL